jgi:hypothetical protein
VCCAAAIEWCFVRQIKAREACISNEPIQMKAMISQSTPYSKYDPNRLLNTIMSRLSLKSDRELSRKLHISYKLLEKIRSGALTISPSMLLWMAECAQTSIEELRSVLGERRSRARMHFVKMT